MNKGRKKRLTARKQASGKNLPGFAAFLDLRDSTYVWNQNPDLAEEILNRLAATVRDSSKAWQGNTGNFTGDGFLVLFPDAEYAVRGLAEIIDAWEPKRKRFCLQLKNKGAPLPDDRSLILRTGVAFGHYRLFRGAERDDVAGEAINRASRCENASKKHFESDIPGASLAVWQRVFVTQNVFDLIQNKSDFWYSAQLIAELKGYERPTPSGHAQSVDHIVAMWPKIKRSAKAVTRVPQRRLRQVAREASRVDVADRLLAAVREAEIGDELRGAADGSLGRAAGRLLDRAISTYKKALSAVTVADSAVQFATIQNSLGIALANRARLVAGGDRARRLEQAVAAFSEALKVRTLESSPVQYAITQNNLGNALGDEAGHLTGAVRAQRLQQAVRAYREALRVLTLELSPTKYAAAQNNLGATLRDQARFLDGGEQAECLEQAVQACREALKVRTLESYPGDYAMTQSNLGATLADKARLRDAPERLELLEEALGAYRQAFKVWTLDSSPTYYAMAQNNLGAALADKAELLSGSEKAEILEQAVASFREALKVRTLESSPAQYATTQNNLGETLRDQALLLAGPERAECLEQAAGAFREALRVYTESEYPDDYRMVTENLVRLANLLNP